MTNYAKYYRVRSEWEFGNGHLSVFIKIEVDPVFYNYVQWPLYDKIE